MSAWLDDGVGRLGMALLHFIWQGALIGCLAAAGLALLRNARPQARYALCGLALLLCLLWPLGQLLVPQAPIAEAVAVALPVHVDPVRLVAPARGRPLSVDALQASLPTVVLLWSVGTALMALRLVLGLAWVHRLGAAVPRPVDPVWAARLAALARRMGLRRVPSLRVHDGLDGPITVGRWRPLILLPASLLTRLPVELVEALLAHELAHVRRLDYLANLVQSVVEALLFYHPVVWWLSRRMRVEREQIADDLAARALGEPRRLALALSELASWQSTHPPLALAAQGGHLMSRIHRLVRPTRQPLGGKLLPPLAGLFVLAAAAHAARLTAAPLPLAAAVVQATPAASAAPAGKAVNHAGTAADAAQSFAFALVSGSDGPTTMSGNDKDMREVRAKQAALHGSFLWVRQGAQRYLVTDPAALAEAQALWAPVRAFDAEMEQLGRQLDAQADIVGRRAGEIEALHAAPSAELDALGKQMAVLQKQRDKAQKEIDKLSRRMAATRDDKLLAQLEQQQDRLEQALEPLDASIDALAEQMEQVAEALDQAMNQHLAQQDEDADQAMEALSQQMEALGERQEAAAQAAETQLRALIQDFVRRGLARQG